MDLLKTFLLPLLCALSPACSGQQPKYEFSSLLEMEQAGCNRVLCMKNGNTMLFHFEIDKPVVVKVFDSLHKEVASQKQQCRILDESLFKKVVFKGLFEINGEAVLFMEQEHLSKSSLVRLRYNAADGILTDEKLLLESQNISKPTSFFVMYNKGLDNYAILYSTDMPNFKECKVYVTCYNSKHEATREIPLDVDRKKYDFLNVIGAELQPNGICVSLCLSSLAQNGTLGGGNDHLGMAAVYDHFLALYYIPKDSAKAKSSTMDITEWVYPSLTQYTYNAFARNINVLLLSHFDGKYKFGLEWRPVDLFQHLFFSLDEDGFYPHVKTIKHKIANEYLEQKTDTTHSFDGPPVAFFTNGYGLSTIVSESYTRYSEPERGRYIYSSYLGNIGITQFDDDGNELWGTVLPNSQCFRSYHRYYPAKDLSEKWQDQALFDDLPDDVYNRQFLSLNTYFRNKNCYIIYNDYNNNFDKTIEKSIDTVYSSSITNACYYKINSKKEITKDYLFGTPGKNEYRSCFIEGADFDDKRGVYAALVQYNNNDKISLVMAWRHLD